MTVAPSVRLVAEPPEPDELVALYRAVGWTAYTRDPRSLVAAVAGSHRVVCARDADRRLLGLARTVSDGASVVYLQDILVDPEARRSGIGRRLLADVLDHYASVRQFVLLTDDDPVQRAFYLSAGLERSDSRGLHAYLRS